MSEPKPTGLRAPHGARTMEIDWSDGKTTKYEHVVLRGFCPCAGCQGHSGQINWVEGTEQLSDMGLEITGIEQVGNYAISLAWGDGHSTGIYTFRYLRELTELEGKAVDQLRGLRLR